MKLKTTELNGKIYAEVSEDGKPLFVHEDGKEVAFDVPASMAKIGHLNGEAMRWREYKESAEAKIKAFEGISDPDAARRALETVANIDQGKLIQAGQVEEIKTQANRAAEERVSNNTKTFEKKIKELENDRQRFQSAWHSEKINSCFSGTPVREKLALGSTIVRKLFGDSFKVQDDGQVVGFDKEGKQIFSDEKPGNIADFDEALMKLVHASPDRDHILKGSGNSGSGARQNGFNGANGAMTRDAFNKLNPYQQREASKQKGFSLAD